MTHGLEESHKAESEMSGVSDVSVCFSGQRLV